MTPKATAEAVMPAFLFLAGCMTMVGLVCTFFGPETSGRHLSLEANNAPARGMAAVGSAAANVGE